MCSSSCCKVIGNLPLLLEDSGGNPWPMDLETLLQLPESKRDDQWELDFLALIPQAKVQVAEEQAKAGPDGWPYLLVRSGPQGDQPFLQVLEWAATRGIGLALNTHKMLPDYVFTYGMLWNYAMNRQFVTKGPTPKAGSVIIADNEEMIVGAPTEQYLPMFVRKVMREFLAAQGMQAPQVTVLSTVDYKVVDLLFSSESLNDLKPKDFRSMGEALSWFLPLHYNIIIGSEQNLTGFVDL